MADTQEADYYAYFTTYSQILQYSLYYNDKNMLPPIGKLNNEQLDSLSKLCFDLAKAGYILAFFPTLIEEDLASQIIKILSGFLIGLVFTYLGLLLLKGKKYGNR